MSGNIDSHPLRYSPITSEIESILTRRVHAQRIDGYTLETAVEIATLVMPMLERPNTSNACHHGTEFTMDCMACIDDAEAAARKPVAR